GSAERVWMAGLRAEDDVVEAADVEDAAPRSQRQRLRALVDAAAGHLDVLPLERARGVSDRQVIGAQAIRIEPDVDLPLAAAEDQHLAHTVDAFELAAQRF